MRWQRYAQSLLAETSSKNVQKASNKTIQQYDNNNRNSNSSVNRKTIQKKNSIMNKYYKVNLSKIHFMIFNFDKEMIVEGNKDEKVCKVEKIIAITINEKGPIYHEKDDKFSYLSLFKTKKSKNINKEKNNTT